MRPFPGDGPVEVAEEPLARHEDRGVEHAPTTPLARGDHVVEHLVVDDVGHEVARHEGPVERRVYADEPLRRGVAAELDGAPRRPHAVLRRATTMTAPRDERVDPPAEV